MVAISVDDSWDQVDKFFEQRGGYPSFLVLLDPHRKIADSYGTSKFPETYAFSKDGALIDKFIGSFNWLDPKMIEKWNGFLKKTQ